MVSMSITFPQKQLRTAARSLTEFVRPVEKIGALATAVLIETIGKEMVLLADTQATIGLHANAINICRIQTCLENLRAVDLVLSEPPFTDDSQGDGENAVDEARRVLTALNDDLLNYDDELKAA
jgi:hypothetical protein